MTYWRAYWAVVGIISLIIAYYVVGIWWELIHA